MMGNILIIGKKYRKKLEKSLITQGFSAFWMPDNQAVDKRLAGHADLSALRLDFSEQGEGLASDCVGRNPSPAAPGGFKEAGSISVYIDTGADSDRDCEMAASQKTIVLSQSVMWENEIVSYLINNNYRILKSIAQQSAIYPHDATLCACVVGKALIHNLKISDLAIIDNFGGQYISVKQGYANCSACAVTDKAIITADNGIASAAEKFGLSVLKISSGGILLDGFDSGFIGGASFAANDAVYFTGDVTKHPDSERIINFIESHQKRVVLLTKEPLFDVGGAVVL